ncbi:UNVERIFIED_ORG: hypothetical protein GCAPEGMB_00496 [Vibrio phage V07]
MTALKEQVGGDHYKRLQYQPHTFAMDLYASGGVYSKYDDTIEQLEYFRDCIANATVREVTEDDSQTDQFYARGLVYYLLKSKANKEIKINLKQIRNKYEINL